MRPLLALLLAPAVLLAAPVPKDKEKVKDADAIVGSWKIDTFDNGGVPGAPGAKEIDTIRFVFAEKGVLKMTGGPNGEELEGTFKIDPEAKVKTIDLDVKGMSLKGLYTLDGDTLTLCIPDSPNKERPAEIKADGPGRVAVVTFKRLKADVKKDK